jgi:NADH pyrophosphatase NudC (nudix superfamily)
MPIGTSLLIGFFGELERSELKQNEMHEMNELK